MTIKATYFKTNKCDVWIYAPMWCLPLCHCCHLGRSWCFWSSWLPWTKRRTWTPGSSGCFWTQRPRCKSTCNKSQIKKKHFIINQTHVTVIFIYSICFCLQGDPGTQGVKGDSGPKGEPVSSCPVHVCEFHQNGIGIHPCTLSMTASSLLPSSG